MSEDYTPNMVRLLSAYFGDRRIECHRIPDEADYDRWESEFDRAIAAHDTELREQIAQEIEIHMRRHDNAQIGFSAVGDAYAHAASIARGRTRASVELVERCERCGCDLQYPTAVHIVDCGTREEQD